MTRDEAIEWIEDMTLYIRDGFNRYMYKKEKLKALDMAIEALQAEPVKQGEWIPIEERLPEGNKYILISFSNDVLPGIGRYEEDKDGNGAFYYGDDEKPCSHYGIFANAWMPLPEPYEE